MLRRDDQVQSQSGGVRCEQRWDSPALDRERSHGRQFIPRFALQPTCIHDIKEEDYMQQFLFSASYRTQLLCQSVTIHVLQLLSEQVTEVPRILGLLDKILHKTLSFTISRQIFVML